MPFHYYRTVIYVDGSTMAPLPWGSILAISVNDTVIAVFFSLFYTTAQELRTKVWVVAAVQTLNDGLVKVEFTGFTDKHSLFHL